MYDILIKNSTIVSFNADDTIYKNFNVIIHDGRIIDIFKGDAFPNAKKTIDHKGLLLTPGLIDCHTHAVYAGNRAHEFELRLQNISYKEISKRGGGILSTVRATRLASKDFLFKRSMMRLKTMMSFGATTCEIKSGYGLDFDTEIKMLKVINLLNTSLPITVVPTFLGPHAVPVEYKGDKDAFINFLIKDLIPFVADKKLAEFVDGFCETIAFSNDQIKRFFIAAKKHGFKIKLHAEQMSNQGGAKMASDLGAHSVDHLEYLSAPDILSLKKNGTVAVLLPGAYYFLKETKLPPVQELLDSGVSIAIASDFNPGSSPFLSLPLIMNMACIMFNMTPYQAFKGVTINAAKALGLHSDIGSVDIGKKADIILWNCNNYNEIIYDATTNYLAQYIKDGKII